jgi:hypothetical protein
VARESTGAVRDWTESAPMKPLLAFIGGGMQQWTRSRSNFESVHRLVLVSDDASSGLGGARCAAQPHTVSGASSYCTPRVGWRG